MDELDVPLLKSPQLCRICRCHDSKQDNPLISACACIGSVEKIHTQCLKEWIKARQIPMEDALACELCKTKYRVHMRRRIRWNNIFTLLACSYLLEGTALLGCAIVVTWVMWKLMMTVHDHRMELIPLAILLGITSIVTLIALFKLCIRLRDVSSVTYVDAHDSDILLAEATNFQHA